MRVRDVLANNISWFLFDLGLLTNDLDSLATRTSRWLHDVHMFVSRGLSVKTELSILIWEDVSLWTKTPFTGVALVEPCCPLDVLPH